MDVEATKHYKTICEEILTFLNIPSSSGQKPPHLFAMPKFVDHCEKIQGMVLFVNCFSEPLCIFRAERKPLIDDASVVEKITTGLV